MNTYVCQICGYAVQSDSAPTDKCPQCMAAASNFKLQATETPTYVSQWNFGALQAAASNSSLQDFVNNFRAMGIGAATDIVQNFVRAKQADSDHCPKAGLVFKQMAQDLIDYVGLLFYLTGEAFSDNLKTNLQNRILACQGSTQSLTNIAKIAKQNNYDAPHDCLHNMARNTALCGLELQGIYNRFYQ